MDFVSAPLVIPFTVSVHGPGDNVSVPGEYLVNRVHPPVPEEDYFIVINHVDGHTRSLLLYRVVRHGEKAPVTDEDAAKAAIREISVECVYPGGRRLRRAMVVVGLGL